MSDAPQTPRTTNPRLNKEYEDPHYHDEDETAVPENDEQHRSHGQSAPRRKAVYRPRRRFFDD